MAADTSHVVPESGPLSRRSSLSEQRYKFGDVVVPEEEITCGVTRFPHLNSDQYLIACEEANVIPSFLFEKTIDVLNRWPKPAYDTDTKEDITQYVAFILRKGKISPSVLTCTLVFMTRGKDLLSNDKLEAGRCHWRRCHLFSAALVIAAKILMDQPFTMGSWSRICRISLDELRQLEVEFLVILDNNLGLDPEDVREYFSTEMPPHLAHTRTLSRRDVQKMMADDIGRLSLSDD